MQAKGIGGLGLLYRMQGDMLKSLDCYNKVLELTALTGDKMVEIATVNNIGTVYHSLGNYPKALEYFYKALRAKEKIGDRKGLINSYLNVGNMLFSQGDSTQSLDYYNKALNLALEFKDLRSQGQCYECLGRIEESVNLQNALEYYYKALSAAREVGFSQTIVSGLIYLGDVYSKLSKDTTALKYYTEALQIAENTGRKENSCHILIEVGKLYHRMKQHGKALEYSLKALEISRKSNLIAYMQKSHQNLNSIYSDAGDSKLAYTHLVLSKQYNDSIYNENTIRKMAEQEYLNRIDIEKQTIESELSSKEALASAQRKVSNIIIASLVVSIVLLVLLILFLFLGYREKRRISTLLAEQKIIIEQKNGELKEVSEGKDRFFSILAHDLKGSFNSILGFSDLLSLNTDNFSKSEVMQMADSIYKSAENTYKLLENLLTWSKSNVGLISFNPVEFYLCELIVENKDDWESMAKSKNIEVGCSSEGNCAVFADRDMLRIVLRNLITNALKFTPAGGEINVGIKQLDGGVEMSVTDTGIGMNEEMISGLFVVKKGKVMCGTNNEEGTGLGLLICKEFVEKHNGSVRVESQPGAGSRFVVVLPGKGLIDNE